MPIEQRVIGGGQKIGGKSSGAIGAKDKAPEPEAEAPKKGKKKLFLIIGVVVLLAAGAAAYFLVLKPGGSDEPAAEPAPVPGKVVTVEPISLNLANGHYLRLGFALQLTEEVGEETPDTSKAVDLAIELFSGRDVAEISTPATREDLKHQLAEQVEKAYEGEVMDVYLTNYVTQ